MWTILIGDRFWEQYFQLPKPVRDALRAHLHHIESDPSLGDYCTPDHLPDFWTSTFVYRDDAAVWRIDFALVRPDPRQRRLFVPGFHLLHQSAP